MPEAHFRHLETHSISRPQTGDSEENRYIENRDLKKSYGESAVDGHAQAGEKR